MPDAPKINGWIILDKPRGLGSTQAVGAVKRNLREGGHGEDGEESDGEEEENNNKKGSSRQQRPRQQQPRQRPSAAGRRDRAPSPPPAPPEPEGPGASLEDRIASGEFSTGGPRLSKKERLTRPLRKLAAVDRQGGGRAVAARGLFDDLMVRAGGPGPAPPGADAGGGPRPSW